MAEPTDKVEEEAVFVEENREKWGTRMEFLLSCIGLSVGFGNLWRFPYLAYKNGGAAFLLPYMVIMLLIGRPIYFLELCLGQFTSQSALTLWRCCPVAVGIGWAQMIVLAIACVYYNVIIAYIFFYTFASFASEVPWIKCASWWGADERCFVRKKSDLPACTELAKEDDITIKENVTCISYNFTLQSASEQYWKRRVLHIHESKGIDDVGEVRWDLALCLLLAWIIIFFCLIKGIKSSGKVVYFTALFPYVVLFILIIRGVTLEGAGDGLKFLFLPQWHKMLEVELWQDAAQQVFFSLGISWGILTMYSSYNNFRQKLYIDSYIIMCADVITSLLGCIAIFSVLGHLAKELNLDIDKVVGAGPGLIFVIYPQALALLPVSPLWSILFFSMMITLGLDSQFGMVEAMLTNALDHWVWFKTKRPFILIGFCVAFYLFGLSCVTAGGQYIFHLMDAYGAASSLLMIAFAEMIALNWIYGYKKVIQDLEFMLQIKLRFFWPIIWAYVSPIFLLIIFISSWAWYTPPHYEEYVYPVGGQVLAHVLQFISVVQIPLWAFIVVMQHKKQKRKLRFCLKPKPTWGPADPEIKREWIEATGRFRSTRTSAFYIDTPVLPPSEPPVDHAKNETN